MWRRGRIHLWLDDDTVLDVLQFHKVPAMKETRKLAIAYMKYS